MSDAKLNLEGLQRIQNHQACPKKYIQSRSCKDFKKGNWNNSFYVCMKTKKNTKYFSFFPQKNSN